MKTFRFFGIFLMFVFGLSLKAQNKTFESAGMVVTIPENWQTSDNGDLLGNFIIIRDSNTENIYFLMALNGVMQPEYTMQYSIKNNQTFNKESEWDDIQECQFLSYKACQCRFNIVFWGATRIGRAITFCDGKKSYGIVAMAPPGYKFDTDPVITTFRLTEKEIEHEDFQLSTREQLISIINQFKNHFGTEISPGITWDNLELDPKKNELTFTYGISLLSKDELEEEAINNFISELKPEMMNVVDQMSNSFYVLKQCKKEKYAFNFKIVDRNKQELCMFTVTHKDYK